MFIIKCIIIREAQGHDEYIDVLRIILLYEHKCAIPSKHILTIHVLFRRVSLVVRFIVGRGSGRGL